MFFETDLFEAFFSEICSDSEKGVKMELPKGGGHAIRSRLCMFREGRPLSTWLHFGLHFGVILGAQFATILLKQPQKSKDLKHQKMLIKNEGRRHEAQRGCQRLPQEGTRGI